MQDMLQWIVILLLVGVTTLVLRRLADVEGQPAGAVGPLPESGPLPGTRLPDADLSLAGGGTLLSSSEDGPAAEPWLLLLVSSTCAYCRQVLDELKTTDLSRLERRMLVVDVSGINSRAKSFLQKVDPPADWVALDKRGESRLASLGVASTPLYVTTDSAGVVSSTGYCGSDEWREVLAGK